MNYTEKYHLPQWEESDRIMRTDFNQMCRDIETGLDKSMDAAAVAAAGGAAASEEAKKAQATADQAIKDAASAAAGGSGASDEAKKAQDTADQAVKAAAAAQATANAAYSATNKPYYVGTYEGTDAEQAVQVGFKPQFLIIACPSKTLNHTYFYASGLGMDTERVAFFSKGFTVYRDIYDSTYGTGTSLNRLDHKYIFIAFR